MTYNAKLIDNNNIVDDVFRQYYGYNEQWKQWKI